MHVQHIYMMDSKGLITTKRGDKLPQHKQLMAHGDDVPVLKDLKDVIALVKPHALIGLTGGGPAWHKVRLWLHFRLRDGLQAGNMGGGMWPKQ